MYWKPDFGVPEHMFQETYLRHLAAATQMLDNAVRAGHGVTFTAEQARALRYEQYLEGIHY